MKEKEAEKESREQAKLDRVTIAFLKLLENVWGSEGIRVDSAGFIDHNLDAATVLDQQKTLAAQVSAFNQKWRKAGR
jgi:hypothetical protein